MGHLCRPPRNDGCGPLKARAFPWHLPYREAASDTVKQRSKYVQPAESLSRTMLLGYYRGTAIILSGDRRQPINPFPRPSPVLLTGNIYLAYQRALPTWATPVQ